MQLTSRYLLFACISLLTFFSGASVLAAQNTAFVPLKINATDQVALEEIADKALERQLSAQNFTMLSRPEAKEIADYAASWPPPAVVLKALAKTEGVDYVAVGSLTKIGEQVSLDFLVFDVLAPDSPHTSYRDGVTLQELDMIIQETVTDILSYTNRNFIIASIAPAGNKRIDSGAILQKIQSRPGDIYNQIQIRQDLKSVFSMGYFDNVEIESLDTPQGKDITFRVQEKPVINQINISGLEEITEEDVRDAANITSNSILNSSRLNDSVQRIKELYKEKGYHNTDVTAALTYPTEDTAEVKFVVVEGKKVFIRQISFTGNSYYENDDLEDVIETGTKDWLSWFTDSGILKMDVLKQDTARIASFYHNNGFIEAKVGEPVIDQTEDSLSITFPIQEGPRFRVGTVSIEGDLIQEKDSLLELITLRNEEFLNRNVLRSDTMKLTDLYAENGYAFAEIRPLVRKADSGNRVDIVLDLSKGPLVYFNRVEVSGNTRTRDNVIRRELTIQEGGVFDSKAIRASMQNLQRLGFFEEVNITPQPTLSDEQMDIKVEVKERSTGQFSIGAGYSSSDYLLFMAEIAENNLMGTGNRLSLSANISGVSSRFNLAFTNPRLMDSNLSGGIDIFNWEREYDDYTKESVGGALRFGHPLVEKWKIFYSYSYTDTTLSDVSEDASFVIRESQDINITSAFRLSFDRDTRNRYFAPNDGSKNNLSIKFAGGPLGGDASFTKIEASSSWYFPLPWDSSFHVKGSAGQAFENEDGQLPVYEHFYLGGLNSIRGFKSSHVSPRDPITDERIGGDKMWYTNFEIIFPVLTEAGIRGVVFTDFGNVYDTEEDWDFSDIKKSAGLGIRWLSPMGPLRLEWGYNLDPEEDEESSVWDFSIGGTF